MKKKKHLDFVLKWYFVIDVLIKFAHCLKELNLCWLRLLTSFYSLALFLSLCLLSSSAGWENRVPSELPNTHSLTPPPESSPSRTETVLSLALVRLSLNFPSLAGPDFQLFAIELLCWTLAWRLVVNLYCPTSTQNWIPACSRNIPCPVRNSPQLEVTPHPWHLFAASSFWSLKTTSCSDETGKLSA